MGDVGVILAAAGQGRRMNTNINKVFLELGGRPVIDYSLDAFVRLEEVAEVVIVAHPDEIEFMRQNIIVDSPYAGRVKVTAGGKERQDSVRAGLAALDPNLCLVAIHDGARPLISEDLIKNTILAARQHDAACPGVPSKDTLKTVDDDGNVGETLDRSRIVLIQTPQVFRLDLLKDAYEQAAAQGFMGTDDAVIFEKYCGPVRVVPGDTRNIKITTADDLIVARGLLQGEGRLKIGTGYDVHRLVEGRPLIIGGVNIPHAKGLLGHSDADVLTHAVCDALLGAAGLPDIGHQFPDKDPRYKGINSLELLARVGELLKQQGYTVANIDSTIIAEQPRMAPRLPEMRKHLAEALHIEAEIINIKATTTEGLGFAGRGEGIAAQAVVLLK